MATFYSGLQAQDPTMQQSRGTFVPAQQYGQLGAQEIASPMSGAIQRMNSRQPMTQSLQAAPSEVLQNIGSFNTMLGGSSSGDVMNQMGLKNYNQFESQYGQGSLPWYLRQASAGGYAGGVGDLNLFLGKDPGTVQAGYTYGSGLNKMQNLRDPMTGEIVGYGDSSQYGTIDPSFWNYPGSTPYAGKGPVPLGKIIDKSYAGIDKAFSANLDKINAPEMGTWDVWNAGDNWKRDAIMASRPTDPNSTAFANWWRMVNNLGYIPEDQKLALFRQYRGM